MLAFKDHIAHGIVGFDDLMWNIYNPATFLVSISMVCSSMFFFAGSMQFPSFKRYRTTALYA
jgi:hypothetical protein